MKFGRCTDAELRELRDIVGAENFSAGESALRLASRDESYYTPKIPPDAVVMPSSSEEVSAILKMANARRIPVTARGAGTSIEGNPVPLFGGIVVDMQRFSQIIEVRPADFLAVVEPGVGYKDLNKVVGRQGLFFPPDPGAAAMIGGMIANNASGVRTIRYGATKDYVLQLTTVLASGQIIEMGSLTAKSSSGYDLIRLLVGSEGTLGIFTRATLRLAGLPEHFSAAVSTFPTVEGAAQAVFEIMRWGFSPAALELITADLAAMLNRDRGLGLREEPTLLMEFHGASEVALEEELGPVEQICRDAGSISFERGLGLDERNRLWEARHQAYESIKQTHVGADPFVADIAVPISRYPEIVAFTEQTIREQDVAGYPFGHAGDGNLHVVFMGDAQDEEGWARVQSANQAIVERALDLQGTATGEHGVGVGKRRFMQREHGKSLEVMQQIKARLDPEGILNPGKIFP
ncbi:MAG: FAD-binding oxidoreductase [Anaerolineae bacterium]|nr:FAD-binding oxidoreductase [Anaerolineae bacterium]